MAATEQDVRMHAGTTRLVLFTVTDEDNGDVPLDLTGATASWTVGDAVLVKAATITDAVNGKCEVKLVPADTDGWSGRRLPHQLVVTDAAGDVSVVTEGSLAVLERLGD